MSDGAKTFRETLGEWGWVIGTILALPAAVAILALWNKYLDIELWIEQHFYDFSAPIRSVRGPFVLVLRSFANSMAFVEVEWTRASSDSRDIARPRRLSSDIFDRLFSACEEERFIGIGDGRRLGNLVLVNMPDTCWFDAFEILARHAKAILILPEDTKGLLDEVDSAIRNHSSKVMILMPPSRPGVLPSHDDGTFVYTRERVGREIPWESARGVFESIGVTLPAYDSLGAFLQIGRDGVLEPAGEWSGNRLGELLREARFQSAGDAQAALRELRRAKLPLVRVPLRATGLRPLLPPAMSGRPRATRVTTSKHRQYQLERRQVGAATGAGDRRGRQSAESEGQDLTS